MNFSPGDKPADGADVQRTHHTAGVTPNIYIVGIKK